LWLRLLLLLLVLFIEDKLERRKYGTIRTVAVEYGADGGVASEGTKNNRRAAR
jgi:hypothetical protein